MTAEKIRILDFNFVVDELYREEILDHYKHPHNFGDLPWATHVYEEFNPLCGDRIKIQLIIDNGKLIKAGFIGEGCAISISSASILTDYLIGQKVDSLRELTGEKVLAILGLPNIAAGRLKCALLPFEALKKSLPKPE